MNASSSLFLVVAFITILAALRVVTTSKIMHAALWLAASLLGVAVVFLLLDADFLAGIQVLIYIGAITTMIIFGVMLSDPNELRSSPNEATVPIQRRVSVVHTLVAIVVTVLFASGMSVIYSRFSGSLQPVSVALDNPGALGELLFSKYVVPFEIASVVLLVALIGSIVLSSREEV